MQTLAPLSVPLEFGTRSALRHSSFLIIRACTILLASFSSVCVSSRQHTGFKLPVVPYLDDMYFDWSVSAGKRICRFFPDFVSSAHCNKATKGSPVFVGH